MSDLDICRICLNKDVRGYSMHTNNLKTYYEEITTMKVQTKDKLPKWFCYECSELLRKFHKFRDKCLRGSQVLNKLACSGKITYENISTINRHSEQLNSSLNFTIKDKCVKTYKMKHKAYKQKYVEQIIIDCPEITKEEDILELDPTVQINKELLVKIEKLPDNTENHIYVDDSMNNDDIDNLDDIDNTEIIDNTTKIDNIPNIDTEKEEKDVSSDDENIFLDILKKAANGDNKLVFLKEENIKKESCEQKKFTKKKSDPFSPDVWKKISLTEEEAMAEFQKREFNSKYVNANFKCKSCFKGFSRVEMLERHLRDRHSESVGNIICRFCNMHFDMKYKLKKHLAAHYVIYQCLLCDMKFNLISSATFHANYHSGDIKKCNYCGQSFKHVSTYYSHVRAAHRSVHVCARCGASFVSRGGLRQHTRIKHNHEDDSSEPTDGIYCEKCDMKFASQAAYQTHFANSKLHTEGTGDNMQYYKDRVTSKGKLVSGKPRMHKAKPTTCIHCGEQFKTQAACMKHHLESHPGKTFFPRDTRVICEVCGASLAAVSISSHMNKHTREHLYSCEICGMQFTSKSSHFRHQITHTGERKYGCPLCDKRFTQRGSMKLHYRTFHLKQPYPKRIRKKKSDEIPLVESCRNRTDISSASEPINANRWR